MFTLEVACQITTGSSSSQSIIVKKPDKPEPNRHTFEFQSSVVLDTIECSFGALKKRGGRMLERKRFLIWHLVSTK